MVSHAGPEVGRGLLLTVQSACSELEDMRLLLHSLASRQTIDHMSCAATTVELPGLRETRCLGQTDLEQVCLPICILSSMTL